VSGSDQAIDSIWRSFALLSVTSINVLQQFHVHAVARFAGFLQLLQDALLCMSVHAGHGPPGDFAGLQIDEIIRLAFQEAARRGIRENTAQVLASVVLVLDPAQAYDPVYGVINQRAQQLFTLAHLALRLLHVADVTEHQHATSAHRAAVRLDWRNLDVQESSGSRHHLLRFVRFQCLENDRRAVLEDLVQRCPQRLLLRDREHRLCTVIQADDALLFVDDNDRVLHVLKHRFVGQRRELHDPLADDEPGIDRQHCCENQRYERYDVGADPQVVSRRGDKGTDACRYQQEKPAAVSRRNRRTVHQQCKHRRSDERIAVGRMHEQEPRTPLVGTCQELPVFINGWQLPHKLVKLVCRRESYGYRRHNEQQDDRP
jgi:hypothetical protein